VQRSAAGVTLQLHDGRALPFDQVVIATHSDQALRLLEEPTAAESEVLAAIPYQANDVVLHTDTRVLPKNRKTWSSWNYRLGGAEQRSVVTYNMNILQGIKAPETFCVTLNNTDEINPHRILGHFSYDHPVFSRESLAAQQRWGEINGVSNTWYCGAYWHNGFHEDGVVSALRVANAIEDSQRAAA
jgi:predicted NAD/FAD-binding protein